MEEYDILTLDDQNSYANMQEIVYEGDTYVLLLKIDKDENPTEEFMIVKKVMITDAEYEFEDISEELEDILLDKFQEEFEKN